MSRATGKLLNAVGVAELLGVSRQRVHQIIDSDPTFPQPVAVLSGIRVFDTEAVERWARETGRIK